ncbi:unnamed protein product [Moneuplotes crassus]|uniref:Uncharacterized protein n=1 Tax=Euplotes crassus TaxID=5936 RepID=A0AAD1XTA7_EUPCR|nr:unnamed protein product [Moneuplotes crassus]
MAEDPVTAEKLLKISEKDILSLEMNKSESYNLKSCEVDEDDVTINEILSKKTNDNPLLKKNKKENLTVQNSGVTL